MTSGSSPVGLPRSHSPLHPPPPPPGSTGLTASIHVSLTGRLSQRAARVSAVQFSFTLFDKSIQIQIQIIFNQSTFTAYGQGPRHHTTTIIHKSIPQLQPMQPNQKPQTSSDSAGDHSETATPKTCASAPQWPAGLGSSRGVSLHATKQPKKKAFSANLSA